jgi:hypothetical protein
VSGSAEYRVKSGVLYDRYREWAEKTGENPMTLNEFGSAIQERGIKRKKSNGVWYRGIALKDQARETAQSAFCLEHPPCLEHPGGDFGYEHSSRV